MIRNDQQLRASEVKLRRAIEARAAATDVDRGAWGELTAILECEIKEYRAILAGKSTMFELNGLDDLGPALVKARLARRLVTSYGVV